MVTVYNVFKCERLNESKKSLTRIFENLICSCESNERIQIYRKATRGDEFRQKGIPAIKKAENRDTPDKGV